MPHGQGAVELSHETASTQDSFTLSLHAMNRVLATADLAARSSRPPDYAAESAALDALFREINAPDASASRVLQALAANALSACDAQSAGVALLEESDGRPVFTWRALAGAWTHLLGRSTPRELSPCDAVVDGACEALLLHPGDLLPPDWTPPASEALLLPFRPAGAPAGVIWLIRHDESRRFDREDARLAASLAAAASAAYGLRTAYEAELRSRRRLEERAVEGERRAAADSARQKEALYELADRLHAAMSLGEVYEAALDAIVRALPCDRASIQLLDQDGVMRFVAWRGLSESYRRATEGHSPWKADEQHPEPVCIVHPKCKHVSPSFRRIMKAEGLGALAFIPLAVNGRLIGKFVAYCRSPRVFTCDELDLALTIARQLAFAIDRARAQELLRRQAHELALVTDAAPVLIAYCDAEARFRFVNRSCAERFGLTPDECIGRRIVDVVGESAYEAIRPHVERVLRGEPVEFEIAASYESIGKRFLHGSYAPQFDDAGAVTGFVAAVIDITQRKRVEEALRESEGKLRAADRRKDEFLATLAHELRNPLAPIANALHLLRQEHSERPTHRKAIAILERQTERLARLVDDLLEMSRITSGRIQLDMARIELGGVLERAVETVRPLAEEHRHTLTLVVPSGPIWVRGDAVRLEQVVVNLLNNSIKYTEDGGRIELSARSEEGCAVIRVRDTGIGIEPHMLPRVFEPFTQAERSIHRAHGGLGIGLSLVKRLVAKHGGVVFAKSVVGEGSEFTVRLPLIDSDDETGSAEETPGLAPAVRSVDVLVVEDNADAAESLALLLESSGHRVRVARDGASAFEACRAKAPDLVLLDIGLPQLDGYVVARRLRESLRDRTILVALTGYGQAADRERAREAGFDHHVVKPADAAVLERILAQAAARSHRD